MKILKIIFSLLLSGVLLFSAAACAQVTPILPTPAPLVELPAQPLTDIPCPFSSPNAEGVSCKTLEVPLDYTRPEGPKTKLVIAVLKSRSASPRPDPLIVLPAIGSFSYLRFLGFGFQGYADLLKERDLVFYDARGMGFSEPALACPEISARYQELLKSGAGGEAHFQGMLEAFRACRESLVKAGIDLDLYSLDQHTADLAALIQALGSEQVNLLGSSSGALLALEFLRRDPQNVRSVVLESPAIPQTSASAVAESLQRALDGFFELCLQDAECQAAYPNLEEEFYADIEKLNLSPAAVEAIPFGGSQAIPVQVTGELFLNLARSLLNSSDGAARLPKLTHAVYLNRAYHLAGDLQFFISQYEFMQIPAWLSAFCAYFSAPPAEARSSGRAHAALKEAAEFDQRLRYEICQGWYTAPPAASQAAVSSDVPALILHGELNPEVSFEAVEAYTQGLRRAYLVSAAGAGAEFFRPGSCAVSVAAAYLQSPGRKPAADCLKEAPEIQFLLPGD